MILLKDIFGSLAFFVIISGMSGCTSSDRSKASEPPLANVTLRQLWAEPEKFSGQRISLTVYVKPTFGIRRFERYGLLEKAEDGTCSGVPFRSYSFAKEDIRDGRFPAKSDLGYEANLTGQFHFQEASLNLGASIDFTWDGYLTDVVVHRLSGLCRQR